MDCAKCDGKLLSKRIDGITVDQCDACAGIWFDSGELDKIMAARDIAALRGLGNHNPGHDLQRASCPRCASAGKMVRVVSPQNRKIHIDTCAVCFGQWLDGGELEGLKERGLWAALAGLFR